MVIRSTTLHKAFILLLMLSFKVLSASGQTDWTLNTESDGIKVFMSSVPDSKIKAVKVECSFRSTASQFVALLFDIKGSPEWLYHTVSCTVIKQVSPADLYYYSIISLPWPAQNRDFVAHLTASQNRETKVVTVNGPAVPGFVPVKDNLVRVGHSASLWTITPLANNELKVVYTLHVDPGGALPAWLVNMFGAEGPMHIFKNLKTRVQKPEYRNAVIPFIQN